MIRIKKLYKFMLQTFLPQFLMTFFICMFILMMQFLWKYIEDLVGKGLSMDVLGELFFYASLTMVPLALPLAILLASLMTFGNLGEHFELTAMKSSGVSLMTVMKPIAVIIVLIAIGAFFFQNDVLPQSNVKMWTLLFSARQKSPTLDIPEGAIYSQIPGYNILVKHKDAERDMMYDMLIYDVSKISGYPRVVTADSGRLSFTEDKLHLVLDLHHGEWYEDMVQSGANKLGSDLYRRETFRAKQILIPYDATFNRMDDETMRQQYVGKNITELRQTIDSVQSRVDSTGQIIAADLRQLSVVGTPTRTYVYDKKGRHSVLTKEVPMNKPIDLNAKLGELTATARFQVVDKALAKALSARQECEFRGYMINDDLMVIRRHQIEMQKKFTLSLACLIFFFIGAPLGAIIRKGGLGTPIVISVLLFIVYYVIDTMGYKLARDGHWWVWQGIWLSSAVLLPLGLFLTHKAVNDSAVFNPDAYLNFFRRITGMHQVRKLEVKEVIINEVEPAEAIEKLQALKQNCEQFLERYNGRQSFITYWTAGYDKKLLGALQTQVESVVEYMGNSREKLVINKTMDFPIIRQLLSYKPTGNKALGYALAALLPLSLPLYMVGTRHQKNLKNEIKITARVCDELTEMMKDSLPEAESPTKTE